MYWRWLTDDVHWMTSRQLSPSPATNRNHSPASLSLQSSTSKDSSFFVVASSDWRFVLAAFAVSLHKSDGIKKAHFYFYFSMNNLWFWLIIIVGWDTKFGCVLWSGIFDGFYMQYIFCVMFCIIDQILILSILMAWHFLNWNARHPRYFNNQQHHKQMNKHSFANDKSRYFFVTKS